MVASPVLSSSVGMQVRLILP
ncbi:hypothetical protein DSM3645_03008 [Blastopirellula marina DSM 3645]|uniref:Uncharacterized protein n=1 Tax=Blastopirellula marina DSM 3645 TaxID=314230 RepID=A3ZVR5_9BACT|nr:hypothetical protein DSM3645_03008 [Blastopirellula marina DSM 3645]